MLSDKLGKSIKEYVENYVVFDLETTGISNKKDDIIEISAVKVVNGEVVDTFTSLVNPGRHIPNGATAVNHITDEMVADAPEIAEIMPKFLEFIGDFTLVGHNIAGFDMKFIYRITKELYGKIIDNNYVDTLPFARRALPKLEHHKLTDLASHYGIETEGAHRALNDCIMNQKCFEKLAKE